jgi:UPF0755 protein
MKIIKILLLIALLSCGALFYYATSELQPQTFPVEFTLEHGSSLTRVARQLEQAGLLDYPEVFVGIARLQGRAGKIKAGIYQLDHPISKMALLDMITQGSFSKNQVTIIDGWNIRQLRSSLNNNPMLRHDTLNLTDGEILQRIGAPEYQAEGLFFPETYNLSAGSSDLQLLKFAYTLMQKRLNEAWLSRSEDLPLTTPYQALILASIVEKETGQSADQSMIAGVFINRLNRHMMLQTDPSVIYGIGELFDGNLRKSDLLHDTPYNTYTRSGLPPTPIAIPGLAAINAVLHPAKTDALYFVARGDGSSEFSNNLDAHNRAVNRYQK